MSDSNGDRAERPRICVFAPVPLLTVTIEPGSGDAAEVHLHAGGQGMWVGRMASVLGADVTLCAALGGETGQVLRGLIADQAVTVRMTDMHDPNPVYIHDRREGERRELARSAPPRLSRHETDDLYGAALSAALRCDVAVLTGPQPESVIDSGVYARLAGDLARNGVPVIADLTGDHLRETLPSRVRLLKIASDRLVEDGYAEGTSEADVIRALGRLHDLGAQDVVVSRAQEPALALVDDKRLELRGPRFSPLDHHGAGDSQTAAMAYGLATRQSSDEMLRLGVAAGALNVTRRGLGSGTKADIEQLAGTVQVRCRDVVSGDADA